MVLNGSWVDAPECQLIPHTHCDLTFDLGSDSDYNLQVRAQCGSQLSPWTELIPPFNRRDSKRATRCLLFPAWSRHCAGTCSCLKLQTFWCKASSLCYQWKLISSVAQRDFCLKRTLMSSRIAIQIQEKTATFWVTADSGRDNWFGIRLRDVVRVGVPFLKTKVKPMPKSKK